MSPKTRTMIGRFVLCIAAMIVSSSALTVLAQPAPTAVQQQMIKNKLESAIKFADAQWAGVFKYNNAQFRIPAFFYGGDGAYYDPAKHEIVLNMGFLWKNVYRASEMTKFQDDGDLGAIIILWHEYGHSIQRMLGVKFAHTIDYELQADCLAGATFAMAERARLIDPGDEDEAHNSLLYARDTSGTNHAAQTAHGSGRQRTDSFELGRKQGSSACQLPWPQTLSRR